MVKVKVMEGIRCTFFHFKVNINFVFKFKSLNGKNSEIVGVLYYFSS